MPEVTNEELGQLNKNIKYIGLNLNDIPDFLKKNKIAECNLAKEYRDKTYKVYKYIDVNDIQIFITSAGSMSNIQNKCKEAKTIGEYLSNEELKNSFIQMAENVSIEKLEELENEQDRFDITYPYTINYKNALKWRVYYSSNTKKYFMLVSSMEKETEAMFLLLKKQIQSNKEKIAIKIFIPIANEGYSENFLNSSQITEIENNLWFFTKKWPSVYEVVDIYGKRSMHIIGKNTVYENVESFYKILIKDKNEAIEKYELLKELFLIESNLKDEYNFNIKIDEKGLFQIFYKDQELSLNSMNEFLNSQAEEKINKTQELIDSIEQLETKLGEGKQELEKKTEDYNFKQNQIVTFLQCKRTFLGRFKYFFKSGKKRKKINKIPGVQKVEIIDDEVLTEIYEKKEFYYIEDLLAICRILNKYMENFKTKSEEFKNISNKNEILSQKIKNADLFINEIESHKHSIFEFWKFTNKDIPNKLTEAEKIQKEEENNNGNEFNFLQDIEKLEKQMDNIQMDKLSKNELDAIFISKDYINIINALCKKELDNTDIDYINEVLENDKKNFEKEKLNQNIIYYDARQNINVHIKEVKKDILKNKFKIMNFSEDIELEAFKENLLKVKRILEKAYNKISVPYNIPVYNVLKNNQMHEWSLNNLDLQEEITEEKDINLDIIKYNIPKNSPALFYTNHVLYLQIENDKNVNSKERKVLINLNEFEISLKGKHKEKICIQNNEYDNVVKTIKIYEYDLVYKKHEEDELLEENKNTNDEENEIKKESEG